MHLVTFVHDGSTRIGALQTRDGQEVVVDLSRAEPRLPKDMLAFLAGGAETRALAAQALADPPSDAVFERAAVRLTAPRSPERG